MKLDINIVQLDKNEILQKGTHFLNDDHDDDEIIS